VLSELLLAVSDTVSSEDCPKIAELGDVSSDMLEAELFSSNSPCWRSAELRKNLVGAKRNSPSVDKRLAQYHLKGQ
jgi:hypothetical protein